MILETMPDVNRLTAAEKLLLVSELWDDLAAHPTEVPVSREQIAELDRRMEAYRRDPSQVTTWEAIHMATRAARGKLVDFDLIMSKVPDVPPQPGDELPPGYVSPLTQ